MSYERTDMTGNDLQEPSSHGRVTQRVDMVSVVAGLLFIAIALAALADRYWTEVDGELMFGGAIVAVGLAMMASAVRRHRHRERPDKGSTA